MGDARVFVGIGVLFHFSSHHVPLPLRLLRETLLFGGEACQSRDSGLELLRDAIGVSSMHAAWPGGRVTRALSSCTGCKEGTGTIHFVGGLDEHDEAAASRCHVIGVLSMHAVWPSGRVSAA